MGLCLSSSLSKDKLRKQVTEKFDAFDYRISPDDVFTFTHRSRRELTGMCAPDKFIQSLYKVYREFIIETATEINYANNKSKKKLYIGKIRPPPLIEEMWCLAILYSRKYVEIGSILVGETIDRVPGIGKVDMRMVKKLWPDYEDEFLEIDKGFIVWVLNKNAADVFYYIYTSVTKILMSSPCLDPDSLCFYLNEIHDRISKVLGKIDLTRSVSSIPSSHKNMNLQLAESPSAILEKILTLLPENLLGTIKHKFLVGDTANDFIQEYARFMTLIFFTKYTLTPSEEVDIVWHEHQMDTIAYRTFCDKVYGRFIHHSPTVGGNADAVKFSNFYQETLDFYKFLFKESPPIGLWPNNCDRFNPRNFVGSWYSFARLFDCAVVLSRENGGSRLTNLTQEMFKRYFEWTGKVRMYEENDKENAIE
ncbi:hypothetical protein SteCoe_27396 [Stentor coeruleus]|uniref:Uncharacterized protein n=1 Tax=Stentor coeruleus TaxID=5963 RepID=A0A1R2BAZ0_9CILI|nr:hypothetical protein SteCoe_27396 [Stentor coeruleus]